MLLCDTYFFIQAINIPTINHFLKKYELMKKENILNVNKVRK